MVIIAWQSCGGGQGYTHNLVVLGIWVLLKATGQEEVSERKCRAERSDGQAGGQMTTSQGGGEAAAMEEEG